MKKINYNNIKVYIYTDPIKFINCKEKPFGNIPKGAIFGGIIGRGNSTGFAILKDKIIKLYVAKNCDFRDLLSTVSHELGHLIEGGFKKNPPEKSRYDNKHEQKAEHYENFTIDAYDLTQRIFKIININPIY